MVKGFYCRNMEAAFLVYQDKKLKECRSRGYDVQEV